MSVVLVIEDEGTIRNNLLETLQLEGFQAQGAPNGVAGLELARELQPDLIVCDIMMPELDGYGVLRELRRDPAMRSIPFVFMSAVVHQETLESSLKLGAAAYLSKPFTVTTLLETIEKCGVRANRLE